MRFPPFTVGIFGLVGVLVDGRTIARAHGLPDTTAKAKVYTLHGASYEKNRRGIFLQYGAERTLGILKGMGVTLAIVSAAPKDSLEDIKRLYLKDYFGEKIYLDVQQKEKEILKILEDLKISPKEAFYVSDSREGIKAGKNTGVVTIGFTQGYGSLMEIKKARPNRHVRSLLQIACFAKKYTRKQ